MKHSILIVDDNDTNLDLLKKILELEGYQVNKAHNGMEAIESVIQARPDLAILDVRMPDMGGFELCSKLRQPPIGAKIPIVMLTAMNTEVEQEQAIRAGANDIWSKPFEMDIFLDRIKVFLAAN